MGWEDVTANEDKEIVNYFLSLGDKLSDGVEDMKAAKRDLAIIEIAMREKEDER